MERLSQLRVEIADFDRAILDRGDQMKEMAMQSRSFQDMRTRLDAWLALEEAKLASSSAQATPLRREPLRRRVLDLQHMLRDLDAKAYDLEHMSRTAREMELVNGDRSAIAEVEQLRERLSALRKKVDQRQAESQKRLSKAEEYEEALNDLTSAMTRLEERRSALERAPADQVKSVDRVKALLEDTELLEAQLDELRSLVAALHYANLEGTEPLEAEVAEVARRFGRLRSGVERLMDQLRTGDEIVDRFKNRIRILQQRQGSLDHQVDTMPNTALDADSLHDQMDDLTHVLTRLDECRDSIDSFCQEAGDLERQGFTSNVRLGERIDKLSAQNARSKKKAEQLLNTFRERREEVVRFAQQQEELRKIFKEATGTKIYKKAQKPDGQQSSLQDLRKFQKTHVEPAQQVLVGLNASGHALLRQVPPGISATKVEHDLERASKQVSELAEIVSQGESNLDSRMLRPGRFPELFESTKDWVTNTEATLSRQRPPSSEYQVVKSQLSEAKLLSKMIADRNVSLEALNDLGFQVSFIFLYQSLTACLYY